jgi:hypothetical protein
MSSIESNFNKDSEEESLPQIERVGDNKENKNKNSEINIRNQKSFAKKISSFFTNFKDFFALLILLSSNISNFKPFIF